VADLFMSLPKGRGWPTIQGRVQFRNAPPQGVNNIAKFERHDLITTFYCL
jgi:hypothetical protein